MNEFESLKASLDRATAEPQKQPKPFEGIRRADIPPKGGAWLVEVPRAEYWGRTHGVEFRNGRGILEADLPDAVTIAHRLEHDFGYRLTALDARLADKARLEFAKQERPKTSGFETLIRAKGI